MKRLYIAAFVLFMALILTSAPNLSSGAPKVIAPGLEQVIKRLESNKETFIVVYHAKWCGWCHKFRPVVEKVAAEKGIFVVRVDTDKCFKPKGLRGLPAFQIYNKGIPSKLIYGYKNEAKFRALLEENSK